MLGSVTFRHEIFLLKHTNANDVELETTFEEFAFNLGRNAVEADMALGHHRTLLGSHCSCHDMTGWGQSLSGLRMRRQNQRCFYVSASRFGSLFIKDSKVKKAAGGSQASF